MEAPRDQNHITTKLGLWCVDGVTPIPIAINPVNGAVKVDQNSTISFDPATIAPRDENHVPIWMGENSVTGEPCPIYVNADGEVLLDT